ncbi:MAG: HK97 gp10 family phage protein [Thiohalorhabdus sp.]|uniref:HK97 gp10 family phage protein n=1 Tax=Thiohalorhabdus sp. TaxID=3094134 RepID=UPI0039809569
MSLRIEVRDAAMLAGLRRAPRTMDRNLRRGVSRSLQELAREARRRAPKATSTLTNSIRAIKPLPLAGMVVPGVAYARYVEEGIGPGSWPPQQDLVEWIRTRGVTPDDPSMDDEDLAYVIARAIHQRGIPPQPYMAPTYEAKRDRVEQILRRSAYDGLKEAGFAL